MSITLRARPRENLSKTALSGEEPAEGRNDRTDEETVQALGRIQAIVKQVGTSRATACLRYSLGERPTTSRKVRLNVPGLPKPTSKQMSVMLRSVSRSRNMAR